MTFFGNLVSRQLAACLRLCPQRLTYVSSGLGEAPTAQGSLELRESLPQEAHLSSVLVGTQGRFAQESWF